MSNLEFFRLRRELQQARTQKESARLAYFQTEEQLRKLQLEYAQLQRSLAPNNPEHQVRLQQAQDNLTRADQTARAQQQTYQQLQALEQTAFKAFASLTTDPTQDINQCDDGYPFLLLPVRLETRFKEVSPGKTELWVRVYPDECAVDTFEPVLSQAEIVSAQTYWIEVWQASGDEAQERAAWRRLITSHGSGRAYWILHDEHHGYRPLNLDQKPFSRGEVILVIPTEIPPDETEQLALVTYWEAIWLAQGDPQRVAAARISLDAFVGTQRADYLIQEYQPVNLDEALESQDPLRPVAARFTFLIFSQP
jgi:hypothetical protein